MSTKMYFLLGLLGVSFLGYLLVEIIEIRKTDYQKIVSDCEMEDDTTT